MIFRAIFYCLQALSAKIGRKCTQKLTRKGKCFIIFSMANEQNTQNSAVNIEDGRLSGPSIWSTILDLLFGVSSVDKKTKNELSEIAQSISKGHFSRYFNTITLKASPDFAKFFYQLYEKVHGVQLFFNRFELEKSTNRIMSLLMSPRQKEILDMLDENALFEKSKTMKYAELSTEVKKLLAEFHNEFTRERVLAINAIYNAMCVLRAFVSFDYYALLRMFDPELREEDFSHKPHFYRVWGVYLVEQLADFESRLKAFLAVKNWTRVFEFINSMSNSNVIDTAEWEQLILLLETREEPPLFENICKLIKKDPKFEVKPSEYKNKIVEKYVKTIDDEAVNTMQTIFKELRAAVIRRDVRSLFPNGYSNPLKYYVSDLNELFRQKNLEGYVNCDPLSYLMLFLQKYAKDEIDYIASELNVYGKAVDKEIITDLLENCKKLTEYADKIAELDGKLNPQLAQGYRFHSFLSQKIVKEQEVNNIRTQLDLVNAEALKIVKGAFNLLLELEGIFKKLHKDCQSAQGAIVSNWKELASRSTIPYEQRTADIVDGIEKIRKLEANYIS